MSRRRCPSGKTAYRSKRDAKNGATAVARGGDRRMRPYLCPDCHHWHVTANGRTH